LIVSVSVTPWSDGAVLRPEALKAWESYVKAADARLEEQASSGTFLWAGQAPSRVVRAQQGEILTAPAGKRQPEHVPLGLIHHWIGCVFIPNVQLEQVTRILRDYDRYPEYFKPTVLESRTLSRDGASDAFSVRILNRAGFARMLLQGEYVSSFVSPSRQRWYSITTSTRLEEVQNPGTPEESTLPPGQGHGYVWRLHSIARAEQRDKGVFLEVETMALSRDIPAGLGWFVEPIARRIAQNTLIASLKQVRDAVLQNSGPAARAAVWATPPREHPRSRA
jgi:hypothetical protein